MFHNKRNCFIIKVLSLDEERDKNKTINLDIYHTIMNIYGANIQNKRK